MSTGLYNIAGGYTTGPISYEVSGSVTALGDVIKLNTTDFESVCVQVTSAGSATITYEASNDDVTYYAVAGFTPLNTGTTTPVTTSTTAILLCFPTPSKFFRARVSAYTSGTVSATAVFSATPLPKHGAFVANASVAIAGVAAHDAAISGNPVRIGGRALTANYTAVQTGDAADFVTTLAGSQITKPFSIPELDWSYAAAASGIVNTTTAVTVKAAAGAGIRNYITGLSIQTATLGGATEFAIRDGAAGTVIFRTQLQTTALPLTNIQFPTPLKGTANTLLEIVTLTAVTGGVYCNLQGYSAP